MSAIVGTGICFDELKKPNPIHVILKERAQQPLKNLIPLLHSILPSATLEESDLLETLTLIQRLFMQLNNIKTTTTTTQSKSS